MLAAQSWSIDTYVGRANYDLLPSTVNSTTGVLGARYRNQDHRSFQATFGAPFSNDDVTWGVMELGDRFAVHRGGLETGVDVSLLGHAHWDPIVNLSGKGVMGEFLPVISHNVGAGLLEFRSGLRWYGSRLGDTDWTRALWTTDVRGSIEPTARVRLEGSVRHDRARLGENYTRPGMAIAAAIGRVAVGASAGTWTHNPNDSALEWGLSFGIPIQRRMWLISSAHHQTFDPTFLISPRTSWSIGLSFQVGGEPRRTVSGDIREGTPVVIRVPLRESGTAPSVAGDFTNWRLVRMARYGHEWRLTVSLTRGVYHFAFRDAQGKWFVPPSVQNRVDDSMGGHVAVLVIP
jgi:hypothetical protein